jgi:hypothetical protein
VLAGRRIAHGSILGLPALRLRTAATPAVVHGIGDLCDDCGIQGRSTADHDVLHARDAPPDPRGAQRFGSLL